MNAYTTARIFLCGILMTTLVACRVNYSFTGADIPEQAKTLSVATIMNNASVVNPTLSQKLTNALKDEFQNHTRLMITSENGDLRLEGEITGYDVTPVAIQGNETAAMNRLTITINIRDENTIDSAKDYEQRFSRYADYESSKNLSDVENTLCEDIIKVLVEDVFNKSVVNW